jgi:hypothetical protein
MKLVILILAMTAVYLALLFRPAGAQTPDDVIAMIQSLGGPYSSCLLGIARTETGGTFDPYALNPHSGAIGPLQFMQAGGIWDETPDGRAGIPVTQASVAEQVRMGRWALENGHLDAWGGSCG